MLMNSSSYIGGTTNVKSTIFPTFKNINVIHLRASHILRDKLDPCPAIGGGYATPPMRLIILAYNLTGLDYNYRI